MSDPTVNPKLDQVWSPADYDETVRDAGRHRAEAGMSVEDQEQCYGTAAHEARERYEAAGIDDDAVLRDLRRQLSEALRAKPAGAKWIPIHTVEAEQAEQIRHELGIDEAPPKLPAEKMRPDVEPFLPFRRAPGTMCQCCAAWPDEKCEPGCLSTMTDEQQRLHRDTVLDQILAELEIEHSLDEFDLLFLCHFLDDSQSVFPHAMMMRCGVDAFRIINRTRVIQHGQ